MKTFDIEKVKKAMKNKHYDFFEKGDYNLNIIGVRNSTPVHNTFDDTLILLYKERGIWIMRQFAMTTEPGKYWLNNPGRVDGTAIMVPGQYKGAYKIGLHKGIYECLHQEENICFWRDNDKDNLPEVQSKVFWDKIGANIHRANENGTSTYIEKWSAACQVLASSKDYEVFMSVIHKASQLYGDTFTYTLLESKDIV